MQNEIKRDVIVMSIQSKQFAFSGWRFLTCAAALSLPAVSASAEVAAPQTVWAKADVSYEQYRAEALECGMQGLATNIDNTEEVQTLARATAQLEAIDARAQAQSTYGAGQLGQEGTSSMTVYNGLDVAANRAAEMQSVLASTRTDEQYAGIKEKMFVVVRNCMIQRGYTKIALTEAQRDEYREMRGDVAAQRSYVHELASDPDVLEAQSIPVTE